MPIPPFEFTNNRNLCRDCPTIIVGSNVQLCPICGSKKLIPMNEILLVTDYGDKINGYLALMQVTT